MHATSMNCTYVHVFYSLWGHQPQFYSWACLAQLIILKSFGQYNFPVKIQGFFEWRCQNLTILAGGAVFLSFSWKNTDILFKTALVYAISLNQKMKAQNSTYCFERFIPW